MIETGAHLGYVLAAWSGAGLLTAGAIAWVVLDALRQKAKLDALEAESGRRRDGAAP